ncbi:MAG TPA: vitamin K epoxide reductase family protein [Candidatus Binatia bacterium]|nr:vitamin K epoxide reductase family protein [Candidatus Binatia bacterium]
MKGAAVSASTGNFTLAALVSLVGLGDAIYLTVEHLTGNTVRCTVTSGCSEVLGSAYASIGAIPLAGLGALAYFMVFGLATLAAFGHQWTRSLLAVLVAMMLTTTVWLMFVQAFILRVFCQYCLLSAAVTLALSGIVAIEWIRYKNNLARPRSNLTRKSSAQSSLGRKQETNFSR